MQGQLFTQDFLTRGVLETPPCQGLSEPAFAGFADALRGIFKGLDGASTINEAQTEQLVINKVLAELGWADDTLPQVNADPKGREAVPDCLLFASSQAKAAALAESRDDRRYRHGLAILEAKRWLRPLDRGDGKDVFDPDAPSSQMLRYLSRVDVASDRAVKWGMLTNGAVWRLYWQDARSRAEEFFEIDLAAALGLPGVQHDIDDIVPAHALRLFHLFFSRSAFLPQDWDAAGRSFHAYALNEARLYEEKVSQDLGTRVFGEIFPQLADALARGDLHAQTHSVGTGQFSRPQFTPGYLDEVREAALVLLYRLLFMFYAEDRQLLPVRDARYAPYSVRRLREEVRDKVEAGTRFSKTMTPIWQSLQGVFELIDKGDDDVGMPAYNGGLFERARAPLLARTKVPDAVMAPIIDALSRRTEDLLHGWINYRDLAVAHLGGIYERLLEYSLVHEVQARDDYKDRPEINRIIAAPASFARKVSGSYYTHDDLVRLVLRESVGLLAAERMAAFESHLDKGVKKGSLNPGDWDALDPASRILELKICDPAMGSGHFLVALVDDLADRVLEAITTATHRVNAQPWAAHLVETGRPWQSPVLARIAQIRRSIKTTAKDRGWAVTDAQLDDRHIVRRMVLKKSIFGVDKNPMAVELAKTALWLHTFTVGAPLSFLDHHLKVGDSLHGERLPQVQRNLQELGALLLQSEFDRLALAARNLAQVADLTDVDIAEAQLSKKLAHEAAAQVAPVHAVLDFWRAMRWLAPGWPVQKLSQLPRLLKLPADPEARSAEIKAGKHPEYAALLRLFDPNHNLVTVLAAGQVAGDDAASRAANALMARARALAGRETFFHWWTSFPTVFGAGSSNGFDAVIGNPPWDRIKLQEVEWFSERVPAIAAQPRAADRKKMIAALQHVKMNQTGLHAPPVVNWWAQYQDAAGRAETNARVLGNGKQGAGDYPLLGGGDVNLYSLFVERAQALAAPGGLVALVTPSGIAADKGAAEFFCGLSSTGRLAALFDFENRKVFFPDVHASFKFCTLVFGGLARTFAQTRCAFYLHSLDELDTPGRVLTLTSDDFLRVNPNTGAAPIFRSQRDADITLGLYARHPVLVKHGEVSASTGRQPDEKAWPVKYQRMFDMTNDSTLFLKPDELVKQGFKPAGLNRWRNAAGLEAVPLYEGKMVQMYDHRAADVVVNTANLKRAAQQESISQIEKASPDRCPAPQYWVLASGVEKIWTGQWCIAYKSVTAPSNMRTMIAALVPKCGVGNSMAMLLPESGHEADYAAWASLLMANLGSMAFDFVLRQKVQGQNLNWFIVEQAAVIAPERFQEPLPAAFTKAMRAAKLMNGHHPHPTVADFVIPQVLVLSYTAHDMAPFARDLGHVDEAGAVLPPFVWDEENRRARLAALDALFFYLYGLGADDARYILDTFPIVRDQDQKAFGRYRTQDDILQLLSLLTPTP
ncbi:Eco57I restriction-modification methylase domain-containing protein [Polaromonas sp.]|uniref:Eco57I restriction-modification methylase domain-containing protein n=1 Tax=Polaromonas sp. TaxID=1869339 RepID=UPI003BB61AFC